MKRLFTCFIILCLYPNIVFAYLDLDTSSLLLPSFIAIIVCAIFFFKGVFYKLATLINHIINYWGGGGQLPRILNSNYNLVFYSKSKQYHNIFKTLLESLYYLYDHSTSSKKYLNLFKKDSTKFSESIFLDSKFNLESNLKTSYFVSESSVVNSPQISTSFQNLAFQIPRKFQNLTHTNTESTTSVIASLSFAKSKLSTEKTNSTIDSNLDLKTMDCHRAIESCNIESCNEYSLDSEKLDCHALQSKARNDDKIDSNLIKNLESKTISYSTTQSLKNLHEVK